MISNFQLTCLIWSSAWLVARNGSRLIWFRTCSKGFWRRLNLSKAGWSVGQNFSERFSEAVCRTGRSDSFGGALCGHSDRQSLTRSDFKEGQTRIRRTFRGKLRCSKGASSLPDKLLYWRSAVETAERLCSVKPSRCALHASRTRCDAHDFAACLSSSELQDRCPIPDGWQEI